MGYFSVRDLKTPLPRVYVVSERRPTFCLTPGGGGEQHQLIRMKDGDLTKGPVGRIRPLHTLAWP